jgi:hypothetical protein
MGIKGFKSQQALQKKLAAFTEDESIDPARYVTVQEMSGRRHALDVLAHGLYQITTTPLTAATGSNIRVIQCAAHGALKNDIIRLSNGTQFAVLSVPASNLIVSSVELDVSPVGDTFTIWRHINPAYDSSGATLIGLGIAITGSVMPAGGVSNLGWLSAIYTKLIASITTVETPKATTYVQSLTLDGTTAQAFVPPANAKWLKIHASPDNSVNLKVAFGGTVATATVGQSFEPGRSEDYNGVSSVSIICKSATTGHGVFLVWGV